MTIPLRSGVESLNAAVAAALILYEVFPAKPLKRWMMLRPL